MKKVAAYIPAWGFYWCGDIISRVMRLHLILEFLFPLYSLFMGWSLFFNDWGELDVWLDANE